MGLVLPRRKHKVPQENNEKRSNMLLFFVFFFINQIITDKKAIYLSPHHAFIGVLGRANNWLRSDIKRSIYEQG